MKTISDEQVVEWACKRIGWMLVPNSGPRADHVAIRTAENNPVCYLFLAPCSLEALTRIMDAVFPYKWELHSLYDCCIVIGHYIANDEESSHLGEYASNSKDGDSFTRKCRAILDVLRKYMEECQDD